MNLNEAGAQEHSFQREMVKLHHKMEQLQILIISERGVTMCNQEGNPGMSSKVSRILEKISN